MRSPKWWYGFKVCCELYESGMSNMSPMSKQQYCKRKGISISDWKKCSFHQCPKFKILRKKIKSGDTESIKAMGLDSYFDKEKINKLQNRIKSAA